jgi:hypothetical protein
MLLISFFKPLLLTIVILLLKINAFSQTKTIHLVVALCDNIHQGIVPVPASLGNGNDPDHNLYWGAAYGVKTYFKKQSIDWEYLGHKQSSNPAILERILFKHKKNAVYLLADAYEGQKIKSCIKDFLNHANRQNPARINHDNQTLHFGGKADLLAYIGHNGLMDFHLNPGYQMSRTTPPDVMILACYSKKYFSEHIQKANANPVLWTTNLMAPEAYVLKAAIDGWILDEDGNSIEERAAKAYHQYQKCGLKGARNLFTTGF